MISKLQNFPIMIMASKTFSIILSSILNVDVFLCGQYVNIFIRHIYLLNNIL